jgi:hypothetical protein
LEAAALARLRFAFMVFKTPCADETRRFYESRKRKSNGIAISRGEVAFFCAKVVGKGVEMACCDVFFARFPATRERATIARTLSLGYNAATFRGAR